MEVLVRLCRALANHRRLAIVRLLAIAGEQRVSHIAEALDLPQPDTSNQLRVLAASGVLWQRRSGTSVYYGIAKSEVDRRRSLIALLTSTFANKPCGRKTLAALVQWSEATKECPADQEIFQLLTAFTHPRRLQIMRWLAQRGPGKRESIAAALSMSSTACARHLAKLHRRGVVLRTRQNSHSLYSLNQSTESEFASQWIRAVVDWLTADKA